MKRLTGLLVIIFIALLFFVSCASKPTQEIANATAAIAAATAEGASTYAVDELKGLNDRFTAAVEKANATTGKLFKSNQEAKDLLIKIKADAETLKGTIPAKKEEAKNNAVNALTKLKVVVDEAKALVETAPKGKDSQAEIEAFKADLIAIDEAVAAIQAQIDAENYFGAIESCPPIQEKALNISAQVKAAIEKVAALKGKKKK